MKPTQEQIESFTADALKRYPVSSGTVDTREPERCAYINGAYRQIEKYPCTPEQAEHSLKLLRELFTGLTNCKTNILLEKYGPIHSDLFKILNGIAK